MGTSLLAASFGPATVALMLMQLAIGTVSVPLYRTFMPALQASANPVVVNLSSDLGSFAAVTDPASRQYEVRAMVYSASKAAVNMLTVQYAKAYPAIKFNAVAPGFTATDLTGGRGRPVDQSAKAILRMASVDPDGPSARSRTMTAKCLDSQILSRIYSQRQGMTS